MPTGYTAPVADGKITELKDFAATCAREFMPFIHQRDEHDSPLRMPEPLENSYYERSLEEAKDEQAEWLSFTEEEKYAHWSDYFNRTEKRNNEAIAEKNRVEVRYRDMLAQVQSIDAPGNVQSFKDFLIDQLKESIDFDCKTTYFEAEPLDYSEWCFSESVSRLSHLERSEKYAREAQERYIAQCKLIEAYADTFGFEVIGYNDEK